MPALHLASFPQPPTYHTVSDDLDVVDPAFHLEVTALVAAFVFQEAEFVPVEEVDECGGCASNVRGRRPPSGLLATAVLLGALAGTRRRWR